MCLGAGSYFDYIVKKDKLNISITFKKELDNKVKKLIENMRYSVAELCDAF